MKTSQRTAFAAVACLVALSACSSTPGQSTDASATGSPSAPTPSAQPSTGDVARYGEPAVEVDGRSYSYGRTMSMVVPEHWHYVESLFDGLYQTGEEYPTDFLGMWVPDGDENTGTTMVMFMHIEPDPGVTAVSYNGESGPVGTVTTDEQGRQMEVIGNGSLTLGDGTEVTWVDAELDAGDGTLAIVRTYAFDSSQGGIVTAVATTYFYQEEAILAEVEAAMGTIRTYALP
jgi:hypothetical protein